MSARVRQPVRAMVRSSSARMLRSTSRDPLGAGQREPVDVRAADADGIRAQRERDEHVGARADAAVEEHRHVGAREAHGVDDAGQRVEGRDRAVDLPPAVVRHEDAVDPLVDRTARVVGVQHPLEHHGQAWSARAGGAGRPS